MTTGGAALIRRRISRDHSADLPAPADIGVSRVRDRLS